MQRSLRSLSLASKGRGCMRGMSGGVSLSTARHPVPRTFGGRLPFASAALSSSQRTVCLTPRRAQHATGSSYSGSGFVDDDATLQSELADVLEGEGAFPQDATVARTTPKVDVSGEANRVRLEKLDRPPGRFDLLTNSLVYRWQTNAALARKVTGPMREWATELKYRTGVHLEVEPTFPERLLLSEEEGGYAVADDVDVTIYLFGSERGIFNCHKLMESIIDQDPAYVRLGVFRRIPDGGPGDVEWLMLRRINRELRPPDVPPISLKLPGKWTLLYEQYKEAAIRTLWEETGITVTPTNVFPSARLTQSLPAYYWRVPVYYFVAEVPYGVEVLGPQVVANSYVREWDVRLLRQSPDPIDRAWAQFANPETGCGWLRAPLIDELQKPLRGEDYMTTRYTPPPYSNLAEMLGFAEAPARTSGDSTAEVEATASDKHSRLPGAS